MAINSEIFDFDDNSDAYFEYQKKLFSENSKMQHRIFPPLEKIYNDGRREIYEEYSDLFVVDDEDIINHKKK